MKTLKQALAESPVNIAVAEHELYPEMIRLNSDGSIRIMRTKADQALYGQDCPIEWFNDYNYTLQRKKVNCRPLAEERISR